MMGFMSVKVPPSEDVSLGLVKKDAGTRKLAAGYGIFVKRFAELREHSDGSFLVLLDDWEYLRAHEVVRKCSGCTMVEYGAWLPQYTVWNVIVRREDTKAPH